MTSLEDIEKAVERLSPEKLVEFRAWFEQFDAALFDSRLEHDLRAGQLRHYAAEALRAFHEGRTKEI
jgi:hypothetical protein